MSILHEFILWLLFIVTFLLGYFFGRYSSSEDRQQVEKKIKKIRRGKTKLGVVKRPTVEELRKRGTLEKEEEEEMSETFDKILK